MTASPSRRLARGAMNDRTSFPIAPLVATVLCIAIVNVVVAVAIVSTMGIGSALPLGLGMTVALSVVAVASGIVAVHGWRSYLREQRRLRGDLEAELNTNPDTE
jgi:hypothetical protein